MSGKLGQAVTQSLATAEAEVPVQSLSSGQVNAFQTTVLDNLNEQKT